MLIHSILRGKVRLYKRESSDCWQCATYLNGKERRKSTKEDSLEHAKQFAEDWYLGLRGKSRAGLLEPEKTFREAAKEFTIEYGVITHGQRSPLWVKGHQIRLRLHLLPFFGDLCLSEITAGKVQQYRVHRISTSKTGKPPARSTLHDEIVTLRLVLKTALRYHWIDFVPDFSPPYKSQGKIVHRPWFSPEEYKQLYQATGEYARNPVSSFYRWNAEQVHDFVVPCKYWSPSR